MKLSDLKNYHDIVIQCHDIPDADAIGSGYALYCYLSSAGKKVQLVYSGTAEISKVNLKLMIEKFDIPLKFVDQDFIVPELLITVDCQYGSRNVTQLKAPKVGIIDHHQEDRHIKELKLEFCHIFSNYGSCASVIYQLILLNSFEKDCSEEERQLVKNRDINTALLYGLYMDTNEFSEIVHPADKDLRSAADYNFEIFHILKSSNFNIDELNVISRALLSIKFYRDEHFAILKALDCDPNILGYISDLCNRTYELNSCIVYMEMPNAYKISVRSNCKEIRANELAAAITKNVGNGGGHIQKAGGRINIQDFCRQYSENIDDFIYHRYIEFYSQNDFIYTNDFDFAAVRDQFELYTKRKLVLGYIPSMALKDFADNLRIETLEGKTELVVSPDTVIMCGIRGELYPISKEQFIQKYCECDAPLDIKFDYEPRVYNTLNNEIKLIRDYIIPCCINSVSNIYARKLTRTTRIIRSAKQDRRQQYQYENYMTGLKDDYLAVSENNNRDLYTISNEIFDMIYTKVDQ